MRLFGLRRPSPSMVVAMIALFVALGGTGYAALKLPAGSVGAKQLKKNAVTSSKVKNRSLLARDFRAGQLPAGPVGPVGPKGDPGTNGTNGLNGARGPSDAYARAVEFNFSVGGAGITRNLPAGRYVILAKAALHANDTTERADVHCTLTASNGASDRGAVTIPPRSTDPAGNYTEATVNLLLPTELTADGSVTFSCSQPNADANGLAFGDSVVITAIRVENLDIEY